MTEKINILGVKIDKLTKQESLSLAESFLNPDSRYPISDSRYPIHDTRFTIHDSRFTIHASRQIITANPEIVLKAWTDENFRKIINNASLVLPDGIGLLWAAKFLSLKTTGIFSTAIQLFVSLFSLLLSPDYYKEVLPERIAGVDFMEDLCRLAAKKNQSVYLLGGKGDTAAKTAKILQKKYPALNIAGSHSGPMIPNTRFTIPDSRYPIPDSRYPIHDSRFPIHASEIKQTINQINHVAPDILFVAFGAPKQEFFINQYLKEMPSIKLAMGVGGAFDFISGRVKRAPEVYRELNLEWLFRFLHQPWRAIRIFNATIKFIFYTIKFKNYS